MHVEMVLVGGFLVLLVIRRPRISRQRSKGFSAAAAVVIEGSVFLLGLALIALGFR